MNPRTLVPLVSCDGRKVEVRVRFPSLDRSSIPHTELQVEITDENAQPIFEKSSCSFRFPQPPYDAHQKVTVGIAWHAAARCAVARFSGKLAAPDNVPVHTALHMRHKTYPVRHENLVLRR